MRITLPALLLAFFLLATCAMPQAAAPGVSPVPMSTPSQPEQPSQIPTAALPAATPTRDPGSPLPIQMPYLQFGTVTHLYYTDRTRVLTLARIGGFDWVRQQIHWKDVESTPGVYYWDEVDNIINDVSAANVKLLVNVVQAPTFYNPTNGKPADPKAMGNFVEEMVKRYGTKIGAIEIWNEPNLAIENGGRITDEDPGRYAELVVECYQRIKAIEPSIIVLLAAPSSTGVRNEQIAMPDEEYLRAVYSYKDGIVRGHFDAQAAHPGAAANPPENLYPANPSYIEGCQPAPDRCWNDHPTHYFRHVENIRKLMVEYGLGDHQIWITEYGWATPNNTPNFEFGNLTSLEQQAEYVQRAIEYVDQNYRDEQGHPWVGAMFIWNLNFSILWGAQGNPQHEQASFSLLNPDWSPRPTFIMLQGLHMRLKQEQGR
ncbi:MAG: cellulase family glycosylhydrolase [Roseiflexaceae bacterium]